MTKVPSGTELARPFVPAKNLELSRRFYIRLGFEIALDSEVAIFRVGTGCARPSRAGNAALGVAPCLRRRSFRRTLACGATASAQAARPVRHFDVDLAGISNHRLPHTPRCKPSQINRVTSPSGYTNLTRRLSKADSLSSSFSASARA